MRDIIYTMVAKTLWIGIWKGISCFLMHLFSVPSPYLSASHFLFAESVCTFTKNEFLLPKNISLLLHLSIFHLCIRHIHTWMRPIALEL